MTVEEISGICSAEFPEVVVRAFVADPRRGRIRLDLRDGSCLDIHQKKGGGYSYHWQRVSDTIRFNNAPHFDHLETAPHHMHVGAEVQPSDIRGVTEEDVRKVLQYVSAML